MYQIVVKPSVRKELRKLSVKAVTAISEKIESLAKNPRPDGCKKLVNNKQDFWRVRAGDYRILYTIDDDIRIIDIQHVGHRRDVYNG